MNIMLVSVTERTREIGIRMAVGAKGRHILLQFLLEAVVLTMIGGLVGVLLGTGAAKLFSSLMEWPTQLGMESYAIAVGFSTVVGIVFGFYPAWRASRLDPIEALRYE
jgi:ABC-type antimicrobial peptide transport system permease subunit